eukprot:scaffold1786_cov398-Prasinococcus_capsulatus_cf.AAC.22
MQHAVGPHHNSHAVKDAWLPAPHACRGQPAGLSYPWTCRGGVGVESQPVTIGGHVAALYFFLEKGTRTVPLVAMLL